MLRHHLLIAYRNLKRNKNTFFINLISLSTGLACTLLIFLWVKDELSVDRFYTNHARLYQMIQHYHTTDSTVTGFSTPGLLAETLAEEMPEVEYAVFSRLLRQEYTLSSENHDIKAIGQYTSKDFFNAFSFNLLQGTKDQVLEDKNSIVLSEELAEKLFNTTDNVVGKVIRLQHDALIKVTGIFEDPPVNSSLQFDFVLTFEAYKDTNQLTQDWNFSSGQTYAVLKEGADIDNFNKNIANFITARQEKALPSTLAAIPFSDKYLYGNFENGKQSGGRIEYVRLFSIIALFILVIACINFMNLSTARASRRLKEVGIKKTVGAGRQALILQYLGESILMALVSLALAALIVMICLPAFNDLTGKQLALSLNPAILLSVLGITLVTGILAGSYPALYLSGFNPVQVLKGKIKASGGELWIRKGLVVFQFTMSVLLIVAVLVIYKQIEFVQTKNLGYDRTNIIHFDIEGKVQESLETFLAQIQNIPGVINASSIGNTVAGGSLNSWTISQWEGEPDNQVSFEARWVNYDLIETLKFEMALGRSFSREFSNEDSKIIFNEAAIEFMGLEDPLGKVVTLENTEFEIVGVVKNFHFETLHEAVRPLFFLLRPSWTHKMMVKIAADSESEAIKNLQESYQALNPGFPFKYEFLDMEYQAQYKAEQQVSILSRYFAGLAILISCLGLFGLTTFTAEKRMKEIGVRKILGSSELGIVNLLSGEFARIILTAIVIALPIGFFLAREWLSDFAYAVSLEWWFFAGAGIVALLVGYLTMGYQTFKAARINPVECLRDE